jgi:hypothetical protein
MTPRNLFPHFVYAAQTVSYAAGDAMGGKSAEGYALLRVETIERFQQPGISELLQIKKIDIAPRGLPMNLASDIPGERSVVKKKAFPRREAVAFPESQPQLSLLIRDR